MKGDSASVEVPAAPIVSQTAELETTSIVINGGQKWSDLRLGELWEYRELLFFFLWRDIKVRYKQTFLGVAWAILQPLLTVIVFTVFFGRMIGNKASTNIPYPLFAFTGLLIWNFFSHGISESSNGLVSAANLLKKVYFPRLLIPLSGVLSGIVEFLLTFLILIAMSFYYHVTPSLGLLFVPLILAATSLTALGVGMWMSALNVQFRDVRYIIPFFIQLGLFVTPVIYSASSVETRLQSMGLPGWIYGLNPMAGAVEAFRWAVFGQARPPLSLLGTSAAVATVLVITGGLYFLRMERTFADVV